MEKYKKLLIILLPLFSLCGCESSEKDVEKDHVHVFDQHVAATQYRAEGTTCAHGSTYFCSCVCGLKGTETFEYGKPLGHKYEVVINDAVTTYLVGESFDVSRLNISLICKECNHKEDVESSKLVIESKTLTKEDNKVSIGINTRDGLLTTELPISVDSFKLNKVDIYKNSLNKIIFSVVGEYATDFKTNIEKGEFYISPNNNLYKCISVKPNVISPQQGANCGTFTGELDITDIPLSNYDNVLGNLSLNSVYSPHFLVEDFSGKLVEKSIIFPSLKTKELRLDSDPQGESYVLTIYSNSQNNVFLPVVARVTKNSVPSFTYYFTTSDTTYTLPTSMTIGYMPTGVDIVKDNNRAIWVLSGKFKGFTRKVDFLRCFSIYFYSYPNNYNPTQYYASYDGAKCNYLPTKDGLDFVLNGDGTGTFEIRFDITDYSTSTTSYFTRVSGTTDSGSKDCKSADSINHNKSITVGSKKYTVMNSTSSSKAEGWGTMSFKIESAN